jgi:glycosyltransferase involved in cell wall biosynthesis
LKRVIVTSSDMERRLAARNFPRLELVPLGVNLDLFRPRAPRRERPAGLDPDGPLVLYVGRLSQEKDIDVLFRAHRILHRECGSQLLIVGEGPLGRLTRRFARRQGGVAYLGPRAYGEDLADLYQTADVVAVPGRNESFCLVVLEALACGLPVVAVEQGGPSGLLARPGLGLLARPGDPADLASKIKEALGRVAGGARERRAFAEENFTWEKSFEKLLAVYESVISSPVASQPA